LKILGKNPLLQLDMRLGEGSGAALSIGLIKSALACHQGMATFDAAGVADKAEEA
jgi:nicotinate-nucleotide--dimethylbenzimidazole phosphoribosyltransferase